MDFRIGKDKFGLKEGVYLKSINKCLKEWNTTIESLGQGKQTILIRNYKTKVSEFLLYPTVSYALKDDYLKSFQARAAPTPGAIRYANLKEEVSLDSMEPVLSDSKFCKVVDKLLG